MKRTIAVLGSAVFFVVAPCTLAGLVPWSITGWQLQPPFLGLELTRGLGAIMILAGVPGLVDAFARFAPHRLRRAALALLPRLRRGVRRTHARADVWERVRGVPRRRPALDTADDPLAAERFGGPRLGPGRCSPLAYCVTEFSRLFVVRHK